MVYHSYTSQYWHAPYANMQQGYPLSGYPLMSSAERAEPETPSSSEAWQRVPFTFEFLNAYFDCIGTARDFSYEGMIELEAMCQIALNADMITPAENNHIRVLRNALRDRAVMLRLTTNHSDMYTKSLRVLYLMVYTVKEGSVEDWRKLAKSIDTQASGMREGEYETLVRLIQEHTVEVENILYKQRGASHLCKPNTAAKNYVSYSVLREEALALQSRQIGNYSTKCAENLFKVRTDLAVQYHCITEEQAEELRGLATPSQSVQPMNLA